MITLLFGDNSFEIENNLKQIVADFDGKPEKLKNEDITVNSLSDIFMGISLFSQKRLIIIRDLSENKTIWNILGDWLNKISEDIYLVLVESKIDKRSSTYKLLKKTVDCREFLSWSERDFAKAEKWVIAWAKKYNLNLDNKMAQKIVQRVGVDQWRLHHSIERISLLDEINEKIIEDIIEPNLTENVFEIFNTAIDGDLKKINEKMNIIEQTEDVYKLSGLLFSQAFQLAVISCADKRHDIAKDFVIHPFVLSKLESVYNKVGHSRVKKIVKEFALADEQMKSAKTDPWLILKNALRKIAVL